ncbi:hypothetical protein MPTK1_2g16210 [Marchantia polymorpha subsp. ruderalis]|uniref:Ribosomal RNA-processing protein 14/surfeit locus protein 6 C-terminal domain-containing protein n=1 Tax=Marchantia polymorpha TaxID=3197 RepID=A0A2R6W9U0_MARPO|nr:hypothetical protein MARPO_0122s0042 [Marchantia polymorpha]BBN02553.1 hypothetical protein Mp_2g16210 [Marchantia polymorpha subsp. ruderalis]|eukprot:PTQ30615.1 hypothetical protein MARPO_0122s0042 [Marchantia polymorpha]
MADSLDDLPALVHSHCIFFDKLVEFIPSKFYIQNEEAHDSWTFKKNKAAKAIAKIQTRENLKKAKRNRLDPEQFKSTLQVLQEKKDEEPKEKNDEADPEANESPADNADRAVTYEELRERLHKRISMLRAKRHAETAAAATMSARSFQNEKKNEALKRRLNSAPKEPGTSKAPSREEQPSNKRQKKTIVPVEKAVKQDAVVETDELEFSRVKMGLDNSVPGSKKRRRGTKEQLLKKATELQEKMQDPEKGQEVISQHSWAAAVSRAAGEKVLDNPKLIKKSMKKDQQQAQKSAKKWQERKHYEKKGQNEKQKTRKDNITQRLESIKERKIAKREKKLMRPGFEGRKAGFINS